MRKVSRYQATADTAPTVRAVLCDASGVDRSVSIRYPASRRVVTMATSRPIRDAFLVTSLAHAAHRSPGATPAVCWPQRAHGLLERSEEHTSELQSPCNLVCRLLLEKKKKIPLYTIINSASIDKNHDSKDVQNPRLSLKDVCIRPLDGRYIYVI